MKTFLKIAGVLLIVLVAVVAYFAYNTASDMRQVQKITKASAEFYTQYKSFANFCDHPSLKEAKDRGFTVSCQEVDDEIALNLNTSGLEYYCRPARTTTGSQQLACVELDIPEVGNSKTTNQLASNSFDAKIALPTLTKEPPMCSYKGDGFYLARTEQDVKYAVMPGVYSYFLPSDKRAPLVTFAINNDQSICSCTKSEDTKEAYLFEYGLLNEEGYIEWNKDKSWPSDQERLDRFREHAVGNVGEERAVTGVFRKNNVLITTVAENGTSLVRAMNLKENGCGGGLLNLFPFEGMSQSEVCGCGGRGVN